jgi:LysM repeat protein
MRIRARLVGLLATLILLAILIGLPAVLLALGANPIPHSLPSLEQLRTAFTTPDDGTLALGAIKVIAWLAWFVLAISILLELVARLRGLHAPKLPGLSLPQGAARQLVTAAALLFVLAPAAPSLAQAAPSTVAAAPVSASSTPAALNASSPPTATTPASDTYTVKAGDTLSRIAGQHLGDPDRWPELVQLNPHVAAHPDLIYAGTVLTLPPAAQPGSSHAYIVKAGDTLSGIAQRELGDADKYPQIFEASRATVQPGGIHLTDADQIDIGQTLTIPGTPVTPAPPKAQEPPPSAAAPPPPKTPLRTTQRPDVDEANPTPATPTSSPIPSGAAQSASSADADHADSSQSTAPWMLTGLTGGGALLAGSLLMLLRRRRRAQFRNRRPGRTLASPEAILSPVEKTITAVGAVTAPTVEHMDLVLRRLAAAAAQENAPMPVLAAVELTATHLVLHLAEPALLPAPWNGSEDQLHWKITPQTPLEQIGPAIPDQPAPYPLLVTIGVGGHDEIWLLNVEDLNITITGDPTYGQDFARYLAAEVACNPWSAGVDVACLGVASELGPLNPDRIHVYETDTDNNDPVTEFLADAVATVDRTQDANSDVNTARSHQTGADAWPARMLLIDAAATNPALEHLIDLVYTQAGHTATSVVLAGARPNAPGTVLHVTDDGRLSLPEAGLDLIAVGLTSDEALGCASLLAHSETVIEVPVPVDEDATQGWRSLSDEAGALRAEHTLPRPDPAEDPEPHTVSLLDEPDDTYVQAGATTPEDLQALAPRVTQAVRNTVEEADPSLDNDLAMWWREDSALPKLHLLGPVRATTRGKPLTKRKPYMTELLAFIALRRLGATPEEVAQTFNITKAKARDYVLTIRHWLGTNPRTSEYHLPDARLAPAAKVREVPVYQVTDLLIDADLFRRLRVRGEARGGPEGIEDLRTALRLVDGRPFDYPVEREHGGGWTWLLEGDRLDEHLTVAIVDVAHLLVTHDLADGNLPAARLAAETAILAAPHEEIPRLDLAAVADAEGKQAEAQRIIRDDVCNRSDDESAPPELPTRTEQILRNRKGWTDTKAS